MLSTVLFSLVLSQSPIQPVAYWKIQESRYMDGEIIAAKGPSLMVSGFPKAERVGVEDGLRLMSEADALVYPWDSRRQWPQMPKRDFTASVWFSGSSFAGEQGVMACIFQPKEGLTGWRMIVRDGKPEFTLANQGGETGTKGEKTIQAPISLKPVNLHRLDAAYDGGQIRFYVDGKEVGSQTANLGEIVYNNRAGVCLGDWWEGPRSFHFSGFYSRAALFDKALTPQQVNEALKATPTTSMPSEGSMENNMLIEPYFQYPTVDSATVMWKTSRTSTSIVRVGESTTSFRQVQGKPGRIHEVKVDGLKPSTTYFVQVESTADSKVVESSWSSFRTAAKPGTPIKFSVVGDTQDNPAVNKIVAAGMFAERPDFGLIVGDLVGLGWSMAQWEKDFFGSMRPFLSHVPLLPVLGNHERNARIYYDLMSVPAPEFYYTYTSGDAQIWVIDTEHDIVATSEQYRWLDKSLSESKAKWKIVAHHFPPYSSDFDDYGQSLVGPIRGGDLRVRPLSALYDKHGVDLCFSGHIHSYERTYPMRNGQIALDGKGTIYMVVGGGGGGLEQFAATRQTYSHTVRTGHHFGTVSADARKLEFKAFDQEGRLFDSFSLTK